MHWLPIPQDEAMDKGYWLVTMRDVYVNGRPLKLCDDPELDRSRCSVAMDTGTSMTMASPYEVSELLGAVGMNDDCSNFKKLPSIKFVFDAEAGGTFDLVLRPDDYIFQSDEGCVTSFQGLELPPRLGRMWVFGQSILRRYYSVYDAKRWRVGVALARHTDKVRARPTQSPAPKVPKKQEKCEDDNSAMTKAPFSLPGCLSFAKMGYCARFPPLADHYCRLSCRRCKPKAATAAAAKNATTSGTSAETQVILRSNEIKVEQATRSMAVRTHSGEMF